MRNIGLLLITLAFTICGVFSSVASAEQIHHKVKRGETLQKISEQYFGTTRQWIKIWEQNKAQMEWPNSIEPGMTLTFDGPESTPTQSAKFSSQTAQSAPEPMMPPSPVVGPPLISSVPSPAPVAAATKPAPVVAKVTTPAVAPTSTTVVAKAAPAPAADFVPPPPPPIAVATKPAPAVAKVAPPVVAKAAPAPVADAVPQAPAPVNAKAKPVQVAGKFDVPPPPAAEKKVAPAPPIHMVEIQPINISRKEPKRAIASVGSTPAASNPSGIYGIRVDARRALRAIGEDPAALAVEHELPAGIQKVNIGKPAFANESGVFASVRVSEEEVHHAAEAQRVSQVERGIQAEQEALIEPLARTYEQIVSETTRKAVESANKIQKTVPKYDPPTVQVKAEPKVQPKVQPKIVERKIASVAPEKKAEAPKKEIVAKRKPASETFSSIEPEVTPAKPKVSNEIIQKLGTQNLFGPDL